MIPGDPARVMAGTDADAAGIEAIREKYGLGDPIPIQYLRWVGLALRGDLGHSIRTRESVVNTVAIKLPITIELAFLSLLIAVSIAIPAGVLAAVRRNTIWDMDADAAAFHAALTRENHTLKRALTDPGILSGIGNAYSDEILHRAKLSPVKQTRQLTPADSAKLLEATRATLLDWCERIRTEAGGQFPEGVTAFRAGMMNACAGPDERDQYSLPATSVDYVKALKGSLKGLRVAWSEKLGVAPAVDPEIRAATAKAARAFRELGCKVETAEPTWPSPYDCWRTIFLGGIGARLAPYLDRRDQIDPGLLPIVEEAAKIPPTKYVQAWFDRLAWWQHARAFFERYDLLLTPTVACPPMPIGQFYPDEIGGVKVGRDAASAFTYIFNMRPRNP